MPIFLNHLNLMDIINGSVIKTFTPASVTCLADNVLSYDIKIKI